MMKRPSLMICSCLLLSLLLLVGCTSKEISKAREAYTNGDYRTVVDLLENMKKLKAEDVELLNHAKIHLTFEAGNYEQVLEMIDTAEYRDEDMASLYEKAREAVEEAEALKRAAEEMAAEVPKADFEFDVDTESSIDGQTHYAISQQEYDQLVAHTTELCNILNEELSSQWGDLRGINIASISINSVKANEEDEKRLKDAQERAVYRDPNMGAAAMTLGTVNAMEAAAKNTSTGPMMAFAGMNMAGMMGGQQAAGMYQMGQAQQMYQQPQMQQPQMQPAGAVAGGVVAGWTCSCGTAGNTGKFCSNCGSPKPSDAGWTCSCGTVNQGNFCNNCGAKRPAGVPLYKCDKCGFEPEDPANPPKFCPQCGDPFNEADIKQ